MGMIKPFKIIIMNKKLLLLCVSMYASSVCAMDANMAVAYYPETNQIVGTFYLYERCCIKDARQCVVTKVVKDLKTGEFKIDAEKKIDRSIWVNDCQLTQPILRIPTFAGKATVARLKEKIVGFEQVVKQRYPF
jgi:hypothetical protein